MPLLLQGSNQPRQLALREALLENRIDRAGERFWCAWARVTSLLQVCHNHRHALRQACGTGCLDDWHVVDALGATGVDLAGFEVRNERIEACVFRDDMKER